MLTKLCLGTFRVFLCTSLALFSLEAGLRLSSGAGAGPQIFESKSDLSGYGLKANTHRTYVDSGRSIELTTDSEGRRTTLLIDKSDVIQTVNLIGDSQVFGWGLSDSETIASQLQQLLGPKYTVVNWGVPGWGPYDYALLLKTLPLTDINVIIFTEANDLKDAYSARPRMLVKNGFLLNNTSFHKAIPGTLIYSRLFVSSMRVFSSAFLAAPEIPMGWNPVCETASCVLRYRIKCLFNFYRNQPQSRVLLGTIPWNGVFETSFSSPRDGNGTPAVPSFDDDLEIPQLFANQVDRQSLFLPRDTHLSIHGAGLVAERIAEMIRK